MLCPSWSLYRVGRLAAIPTGMLSVNTNIMHPMIKAEELGNMVLRAQV
jgi:hypothetical protein